MVKLTSGQAVHNGKGFILLKHEIIYSLWQRNCQHKNILVEFFFVLFLSFTATVTQGRAKTSRWCSSLYFSFPN